MIFSTLYSRAILLRHLPLALCWLALLAPLAVPAQTRALELLVSPTAGAKITSERAAQDVLMQGSLRSQFGLRAEESIASVGMFRVGFEVPGFAARGDRVWQMHFNHLEGHVTRVAWVNAESGAVKFLFPEAAGK